MTGIPILPVSGDGVVSVYRHMAHTFSLWNADLVTYRPVWNWKVRWCG